MVRTSAECYSNPSDSSTTETNLSVPSVRQSRAEHMVRIIDRTCLRAAKHVAHCTDGLCFVHDMRGNPTPRPLSLIHWPYPPLDNYPKPPHEPKHDLLATSKLICNILQHSLYAVIQNSPQPGTNSSDRNSRTLILPSVLRLPQEIVTWVTYLLLPRESDEGYHYEQEEYLRTIIATSQICRIWRHAALGESRLWSTLICGTHAELFQLFLHRAGSHPVYIHISYLESEIAAHKSSLQSSPRFIKNLEFALQASCMIRKVVCAIWDVALMLDFAKQISAHPKSIQCSVQVLNLFTPGDLTRAPYMLDTMCPSGLPATLHRLELNDCYLTRSALDSIYLTCLRSLRLTIAEECVDIISPGEWRSLLEHVSSTLEDLYICSSDDANPPRLSPRISAPGGRIYMKRLDQILLDFEDAVMFIDRLDFISHAQITLADSREEWLPYVIFFNNFFAQKLTPNYHKAAVDTGLSFSFTYHAGDPNAVPNFHLTNGIASVDYVNYSFRTVKPADFVAQLAEGTRKNINKVHVQNFPVPHLYDFAALSVLLPEIHHIILDMERRLGEPEHHPPDNGPVLLSEWVDESIGLESPFPKAKVLELRNANFSELKNVKKHIDPWKVLLESLRQRVKHQCPFQELILGASCAMPEEFQQILASVDLSLKIIYGSNKL